MELIGKGYLGRQIASLNAFGHTSRCVLLLCLLLYGSGVAQLPRCDIYVVKISGVESDQWKVTRILFLNSFNLEGYNNQIFPIDENRILCTSQKNAEKDTEIYLLNIEKSELIAITDNDDMEFSPRIYGENGDSLSCIRIPASDTTKQHLALYDVKSGMFEKTILEKQEKIGYYRHIHGNMWACFIVDENPLFAICDQDRNTCRIFASNIGRCFEVVNGEDLVFVHKITEENWVLKSYNIHTERSNQLIEMPKGTEDFCIMDNGDFLCASHSKILMFKVGQSAWKEVLDLKAFNLHKLSRLCFYGQTLFVVNMKD